MWEKSKFQEQLSSLCPISESEKVEVKSSETVCLTGTADKKSPPWQCCQSSPGMLSLLLEACVLAPDLKSFKGNALVWKIIILLHRHTCEIRTSPHRTLFHLCIPSYFLSGLFGKSFGQFRSIWGPQRMAGRQRRAPLPNLEQKQWPYSRQDIGFKKRRKESLSFSFFPSPGWRATSCCILSLQGVHCMLNSSWGRFPRRWERREGSSEATPWPSSQTIEAQRLPWKAPHYKAFWNSACPCK